MENNDVIDHPDYYRLPNGKDLEDFIYEHKLSFAMGSALKYLWRAGKKHGESAEKDKAKAEHYINFLVRNGHDEMVVWSALIMSMMLLEEDRNNE